MKCLIVHVDQRVLSEVFDCTGLSESGKWSVDCTGLSESGR